VTSARKSFSSILYTASNRPGYVAVFFGSVPRWRTCRTLTVKPQRAAAGAWGRLQWVARGAFLNAVLFRDHPRRLCSRSLGRTPLGRVLVRTWGTVAQRPARLPGGHMWLCVASMWDALETFHNVARTCGAGCDDKCHIDTIH
jgi:hypothetical protein